MTDKQKKYVKGKVAAEKKAAPKKQTKVKSKVEIEPLSQKEQTLIKYNEFLDKAQEDGKLEEPKQDAAHLLYSRPTEETEPVEKERTLKEVSKEEMTVLDWAVLIVVIIELILLAIFAK